MQKKIKTTFLCQNCGSSFAKWQGQCTACNEWNTIVEELVEQEEKSVWKQASPQTSKEKQVAKPIKISDVTATAEIRMESSNGEFDRVLGGGVVPGSVILLGGEPGIGKSTLMLQIALQFDRKTLYISGEESQSQIKMRADRIDALSDNCYILTETKTQLIFKQLSVVKPDFVIIDSIQTLHSEVIDASAGSVSQVKQCTAEWIQFAKQTSIPVILIGHITKDGHIAGPKILEHMVDTVLRFEGDRNHMYRILRSIKNRFGSTSELGIFQMLNTGLSEVKNPSEILISKNDEQLSGIAIASTMEGVRPLMVEIQALVSTAVYGTPQRSTTGFNLKRLNMLLAVLEKKVGFKLGAKDVFLNITGGINIEDPAIDLAVMMAILSSNEDIPIPKNQCFGAEIGLTGELRPIQRIDQRILEADKLGFQTIYVSKHNKITTQKANIELRRINKIEDLLGDFF